jgi:hypothetical protein
MPRPCTVCQHADRDAIDTAIVSGEPNRRIAPRYGLTEIAIRRHAASHLPALLTKATEASEAARADDRRAEARRMQRRLVSIADKAEETADWRSAVSALNGVRGYLELRAKLAGELQQEGTTNIVINPEYLNVRAVIVAALTPYPDARLAVVQALTDAEAVHG